MIFNLPQKGDTVEVIKAIKSSVRDKSLTIGTIGVIRNVGPTKYLLQVDKQLIAVPKSYVRYKSIND